MKLTIGKRLWWLSLLFIFAAHLTFAQDSGRITGTVTDSSGAAVPGATVTALNVATNVKTARTTDTAGLYVLVLQPGTYTISGVATGFETVVHQSVVLDALAAVGLNIELDKLAAQETTVTVNAGLVGLQTQDATLGTVVRNEVYQALPLEMSEGNPRDPTAFIALAPGVAAVVHESAGPDFTSFNGGRQEVNGLYLEGLPITFSGSQTGDTRPIYMAISVDAVDQFQVQVNGESAQFQGQGFHNYTMKHGTNEFHGSLFEYLRNTDFDARNYFGKFVPKDNQNEYGGSIGGPIIKNKLFFFGNIDFYNYDTASAPVELSIPTAAELSGDFSALPTPIYDPSTETCSGSVCTKQQFAYNGKLNVIPPNDLSKQSLSLASYLPSPTLSGFNNNYVASLPRHLWQRDTAERLDWDINAKQHMEFMFAYGEWHTDYTGNLTPTGTALPLPYTASPGIVDEFPFIMELHHSYTFSSSLLNTFGIGVFRLAIPIYQTTQSGDYPGKAGLTGLPGDGQAAKGFPAIRFSGPNAPASWGGTPFQQWINDYVAQDSIEWVHGNHNFTFGGQFTQTQNNRAGASPTDGTAASFSFSNASTAGFSSTGTLQTGNTGNALADYLLGDVDSASITNTSAIDLVTGQRFTDYSLWAADVWKVVPKLTLNLGLHWDVYRPVYYEHNTTSYFDPTLPNPAANNILGALAYGAPYVVEHYGGFQPRIGFAYSPDSKTVIRAGFMTADTLGGGNDEGGTGQNGYNPATAITSFVTGQPAFNWSSGVPTPVSPGVLLSSGFGAGNSTTNPSGAISPSLVVPNVSGMAPEYIDWNAGAQRQFNAMLFGVDYSGSEGHHLPSYGGLGAYDDSMPLQYLALGSLLQAPATPANIAAAQAKFPNIALPFPNFQGTIATMLKPYPQYNGLSCSECDWGNSIYNSLQFTFTDRSHSGLSLQFAYTLAWESTDTQGSSSQLGATGGGTRNPFDAKLDWGPGFIDYRHTLHLFGTYPLPFGKGFIGGGNPILRALLSNWTVSGIFTFQTGAPLSVTGNGCVTPGIVSSCMVSLNPAFTGSLYTQAIGTGDVFTTHYLDKNAFMNPAPFTFGNEPQSAPYGLRAPTSWNIDASLNRDIPINERLKFGIGADVFNLPNCVIFSPPATNINSASFGQVSSTSNAARSVQLHARLTF